MELRTLRSLGGAAERSLGARRLLTSGSLPLPPDLRPSFLLQLEPLLPEDRRQRRQRWRSSKCNYQSGCIFGESQRDLEEPLGPGCMFADVLVTHFGDE